MRHGWGWNCNLDRQICESSCELVVLDLDTIGRSLHAVVDQCNERCLLRIGGASFGTRWHHWLELNALNAVDKITVKILASVFSIGNRTDAGVLLQADYVGDLLILMLSQFICRNLSRLPTRAFVEQYLRS